ncbi:Cullin-4A [Coemansia sp. RSA 2050]|nr:Cullin-4A [Coemansia sp. RSA 2050]KAJ2735262.1 Cullin-4A [Coemansia sp. BCRC 34962]
MIVKHGLSSQFFMPSLTDASRDYYARKSRRLVGSLVAIQPAEESRPSSNLASTMSVPQYLAHVKLRIDKETQCAVRYPNTNGNGPLLSTILTQLIEKHAERLLTTNFDAMVDAFMLADLANFYSPLSSVGKIESLKRYWVMYIKKIGLRLVQAPELDVSLVSELLVLKQRLDDIMTSMFQKSGIVSSIVNGTSFRNAEHR